MTNEEWEKLLEARMREIEESLQSMMLTDGYLPSDYNAAASEVVGIIFDGGGKYFDYLAFMLRRRGGLGFTTLDEAITRLNNLPLGIKIADLQRAEVLDSDKVLAKAVELQRQFEKPLEQLCDEYEQALADENYPQNVVAYVCALEDLVSEMQGKSFTDSSRIGQLEAENAALKTRD
ncbi:hypothetical protein [Shewanella oncorhynchi]|uniref:hypothetical protein n=1 Tax=Shewanella oncorhynchi TaxID=2726434 RepID=UPI003D79D39A